MGIQGYVLYTKKDQGEAKPLLKISQFDPSNPSLIRLGTGVLSFIVEVCDIWGAKAFYTIAENITTSAPTNDERIQFENSGLKEKIMVNTIELQMTS